MPSELQTESDPRAAITVVDNEQVEKNCVAQDRDIVATDVGIINIIGMPRSASRAESADGLVLLIAGGGAALGASYVTALVQQLGAKTGDAIAEMIEDRWVADRSAVDGHVLVVCTPDLPDDAWLALLDLNLGAPEYQGKQLRWDRAHREWTVEQRSS